eukprot:gene7851-biopygen7807
MSVCGPIFFSRILSGGKKFGVPVCLSSTCIFDARLLVFEHFAILWHVPKSVILTTDDVEIRMLLAFRSLCTYPAVCRYSRARRICAV